MKTKLLVLSLSVLLLSPLFASCEKEDYSHEIIDGVSVNTYDSGKTYSYKEEDLHHPFLYEGKEIWIEEVDFYEEKDGAYLDSTVALFVNVSNLSNDERQWLLDSFDSDYFSYSDVNVFFRTYSKLEDLDSATGDYVGCDLVTIRGGIPVLMAGWVYKHHKYTLDGCSAYIDFGIKLPEKYLYEYEDGTTKYINKNDEHKFRLTIESTGVFKKD